MAMPMEVMEYFKKGKRKIKSVIANDNYTLLVTFDNDEKRKYDLSNELTGVMAILKDKSKFKELFLDDTGNIAWDIDKTVDSNLFWNNRIDLCTDSVYIYSQPYEGE